MISTALKILAGVMHNKHWRKAKMEDRLGDSKIIRWWMIRSNRHCDHHWRWKMKVDLKYMLKKSGTIISHWKGMSTIFSRVLLEKNSHRHFSVAEASTMKKESNVISKLHPRTELTHDLSWKCTAISIVMSVWNIGVCGPLLELEHPYSL